MSAALTGTLADGATEGQIVGGGETLIVTLTGDTWDATIGADNSKTTDLINGIDSAQAEAAGWDAVVKANLDYNDVVRTSDTVVTITLGAEATYYITATETMTVTVPASAVAGTSALVATPTFNVTPPGSGGSVAFKAVSAMNTENDNSGTSSVVNFPTNVEGDFLVAFINASNGTTNRNPAATHADLAGWTELFDTSTGAATANGLFVAYRFAPAGGISSATFTASVTTGYISWGLVFTGVDTGTPIDASAAGTAQGSAGTVTAPAVTTLTDGALVIRVMSKDDDLQTFTVIPGDTRFSGDAAGPGDGTASAWGDATQASAGDSGTANFTWTGDNEENIAATFALRPAATEPTAALTGTLADGAEEQDIVTGGQTLIVYLTGDTWDATIGADNSKTTDLINGIDSAHAETKGWDAVVKAGLDYNDVVRSSARTVTITLGVEATYAITVSETITVTVPATAVAGTDALVATPTFDIVAIAAALTGTLSDDATESQIVAGAETLIVTLTGDTWDATIGADNAKTTALIAGIDSAQAEGTGWDAVVKANLDYNDVVRTSDTVVTITLGAEATYEITATETITVTVPATAVAGTDALVATPTFNIAEVAPLQSFGYRKSITIDRTKVGVSGTSATTLSNFPVLVSLTDVNLRTRANDATNGRVENANGYDILFRATDDATCGGTGPCTLDHEIESYDGGASAGTLVAWVRVPSIKTLHASNTTDTEIFIYYGNADISTSIEDVDGVWDANYVGVWHLSESGTGTRFDSTSNGDNATTAGYDGDEAVTGQIDGADDLDGSNDDLTTSINTGIDADEDRTIEVWAKSDLTDSSHRFMVGMVGIGADVTGSMFAIGMVSGNWFFNGWGAADWDTGTAVDSNMNYHAVTHLDSSGQTEWYVNTTRLGTGDATTLTTTNTGVWIGSRPTINGFNFDGVLDEVRISNIVRSVDFITTSYNNQNDPGDIGAAGFYTVGSEDTSPLTVVELITFSGIAYDRAVLLEWRTGYEIDNLGFNLYREIGAERTKLTPSPVAGSGLLAQRGTAVTSVQAYAWWDHQATVATPDLLYWLEDLDFDGTTTWHGPMTPVAGGHLIDVGPPAPWEGLAGESSGSLSGLADVQGASRRTFLTDDQPPRVTRRAATTGAATPLETQWAVAQTAAVKIGVRRTGWVRVTQATLVAAGLDPTVDPRRLQVFADGVEQAITVTGEADGQFDPTDTIGFYGRGVDTAYTDIRVYWVVAGAQSGRRILSTTSTLSPQSTPTPTPTAPPVTQTPVLAATPTAPATPPPTAPVTSPPTATPPPPPAAPVTPDRVATATAVTATATPTPPATPAPAPAATAPPRPAPPRAATARPRPAPAPAATTRATPPRPPRRRPTPELAVAPVTTPGDPAPVAPVTESTPARALMPVFPAVDAVARALAARDVDPRAAAPTEPSRAARPDRNAGLDRQLEATRRLDTAIARARAAGVPEPRIQAIAADFDADGPERRNTAVVDELRRERLTALGYELGMSSGERQRLRALAARAAAGSLTDADIQRLSELVAADPSYFDALPRRGTMTPEASASGDLADEFEPGLDAAWAQMLQRVFEAATAPPEPADEGPEGGTR